MKHHPFVSAIEAAFHGSLNDEIAIGMKAYLRNQFECLGIKKPVRVDLLKPYTAAFKSFSKEEWPKIILEIWQLPFREFQYAAMELCRTKSKAFSPEHLPLFEKLVTTRSWWDTVDFVASNLMGELFRKHPELIKEAIHRWMSTENFWLHRTAIIFQLKYGVKTNEKLLFQLCAHYAEEREFFIRKAIGWALRQYSKSNPKAVRSFIENHKLSPLSLKEASKYI